MENKTALIIGGVLVVTLVAVMGIKGIQSCFQHDNSISPGNLNDVLLFRENIFCNRLFDQKKNLLMDGWESDFQVRCLEWNSCNVCYRNFTKAGWERIRNECSCNGVVPCSCATIVQREIEHMAHFSMIGCMCDDGISQEELNKYVVQHDLFNDTSIAHKIEFQSANLCNATLGMWW